jgi:lipopolysaccharide export system permease protein
MSQLQLARPALIFALGLSVIVYAVSLYFMPLSYREFKDLQYSVRNDFSAVLLQEGVFNTLGDNLTVYVRERTAQDDLRGILVHETRPGKEPVTLLADKGAIVKTEMGPRVVLVDGSRQVVDPEDGKLSMLYFDRYTLDIDQLQSSAGERWRQPQERYLSTLLWPRDTPNDRRYRSELVAEGHRRLTFPAYTLGFVVVGLASILAGEFSRRGQAKRIGGGIAAVALLQAVQLALADVSTRNLALIPATYVLVLLAIIVPFWVLIRRPRRRTSSPPLRLAGPAKS